MRTIIFDTETYYEKPTVTNPGYSVQTLGNWRYCHDPRFDPYLLSVFDGETAWSGQPKDFNWETLDGATLVSHNAGFDSAVYNSMVERGLAPKLNIPAWHCSANLTAFLCNRRALATAAEHLLGVRVPKAMRDWMNGKHWEDAVAAGKSAELLKYAEGDVIHAGNIWTKYADQWNPLERGLSALTVKQCARGIAIDTDKLRRYLKELRKSLHEIEQQLPWIQRGEKATSSKAINQHCRDNGIACPPVRSHDEEAFTLWESTYSPRYDWVRNVGLWRSVNKVITTLETIEMRLRPDNTIDFSLLYFGAHTGRWSGGGAGLNMQNLRKEPIYIRDDYTVIEAEDDLTRLESMKKAGGPWQTEFKIREIVDVRSLFVARPGHKFVISDLAQIEPRVLNWLVGNHELLGRLNGGMSIYEAHARETMNWTGGELKKENPRLYKLAKARVIGLGYGCGKVKFRAVAKAMADLEVSEAESADTVDDFRAKNPKILNLWATLDRTYRDALRESEGRDFEMELPSGRSMRYEHVSYEQRSFLNAETKQIVYKTVVSAAIGGIRKTFYGGKLAENLTQAVARDVFGEHLLALDAAGIIPVFSVHDEAVTEVPEDFPAREVERIMSQTPEWLPGCPIAAEAVEAKYYKK